ncbi:MAG: hypothetical protein AAGF11_42980 [Myxococcota bacterium]
MDAYRPSKNLPLLTTMLALACGLGGCVEPDSPEELSARAGEGESPVELNGESVPTDSLPVLSADETVDTVVQLLPAPTPEGENIVVHLKLPPPHEPSLGESLVRLIGDPENPMVLFSSEALFQTGRIPESPGPGFFATFATFDESEIEQRLVTEDAMAAAVVPSDTRLFFGGRHIIGLTTGLAFDPASFLSGTPTSLGPCPFTPLSELPRWEESLLITDLDVVQDPTRTNDICGPGGNPNGVWTFKYLMEHMAIGSGMSTHDFVVSWLSRWLNDQIVNGDLVPARIAMFTDVIEPWANASGVIAQLVPVGNTTMLQLSGNLDLDLSPFRLSAIVNRIDLGRTSTNSGPYGGGGGQPLDGGELRFVFGVQNLDTCDVMDFSVIFEYGVPIQGCQGVRDWAIDWTKLNDPALPPFSDPWRDHLESLTEQVVVHGAAPGRGNDNAINQIRTNEIALGLPAGMNWELREFTLTNEDEHTIGLPPDSPQSGPLLPHTLAMTPDDGAFGPPSFHPTINSFVLGPVRGSVSLSPDCTANYGVPADFPTVNSNFRGGNSLVAPPDHWEANVNPWDPADVCARHQFSLNTCNGCHLGDTATPFFHVDPTVSPAALSNFLTGGSLGVWMVPDTQFGSPSWDFADLDRRYNRLYDIACTVCGGIFGPVNAVPNVAALSPTAIPFDGPNPPVDPGLIGPITDLEIVVQLLEARGELVDLGKTASVELSGMAKPGDSFVH